MIAYIEPVQQLSGNILIPASKSHTIRAIACAALAHGTSVIINPLVSADAEAARIAYTAMGALIIDTEYNGQPALQITGIAGKPAIPATPINILNSGTTLRIACASAALADAAIEFTGDKQIQRRPMTELLSALNNLGARTESIHNNGCAPVRITGPLRGGETSIRCTTSQFLTALLINCPLAPNDTVITVSELNEKPYVHITLQYLTEHALAYTMNADMTRFHITGRQHYRSMTTTVPGDWSSATFFLCMGALFDGNLTLTGLDPNDAQGDRAVIHYLQQLGASVSIDDTGITVHKKNLRGTTIDMNATPDALPALAVIATQCSGETHLVNVPQARIKETDRIAVMTAELKKMGADIEERTDGLIIRKSVLHGAAVEGHDDHRIIMALTIAGMCAHGQTQIHGADAVSVTFPDYFKLVQKAGAKIILQ